MRNRLTTRTLLVAASLVTVGGLAPSPAHAQARPGSTVRVTTTPGTAGDPGATGPVIRGKLVELDERSITILTAGESERVRIARGDIVRLELKKRGGGRGRHALIGAGIGAGIGLAAAVIEHSRCAGEFLCGVEFFLPVLTAPLGALVGVAVPGREEWVATSPAAVAIVPSRSGVRVACSVRF
jgi:hypothetical protein